MDKGNVKLITCTGYYNTGSSAIGDFLREFSNVQDFGDYEVRIAHEPDGISDLEYNIVENNHRHNTSNAIKRFIKYCGYLNGNCISKRYRKIFGKNFLNLVNKYIESLTILKCNSWWQFDQINKGKIFYFIDVLYGRFYKMLHFWKDKNNIRETLFLKNEKGYFTFLSEQEFIDKTKTFTNELLSYCWNKKSDYLMLDQLVPPSNCSRYIRYFENLKVFIVDRDPRDVYLLELESPFGVVPTNVDDFCIWYRVIREHRKHEKFDNDIFFLYFEDLIYKYDEMVKKICDFLGLQYSNIENEFQHFNPNISIKNTRKWINNNIYSKEISVIEKNLKEFLYDYSFLEDN